MALYISAGRRFRRTLVIAVAAAVVAFAIGWLIGHQQVPSIAERVAEVQQDGESQATGLERLGIEYEQVLDGTDDLDSSVLQPLDDLRAELQATMDRASWLTSDERAALLDAVSEVRQNAVDGVPLDSFTASATAAATLVRQELGG
jgi:hypothetical protein